MLAPLSGSWWGSLGRGADRGGNCSVLTRREVRKLLADDRVRFGVVALRTRVVAEQPQLRSRERGDDITGQAARKAPLWTHPLAGEERMDCAPRPRGPVAPGCMPYASAVGDDASRRR